jgi:hypothetical protein
LGAIAPCEQTLEQLGGVLAHPGQQPSQINNWFTKIHAVIAELKLERLAITDETINALKKEEATILCQKTKLWSYIEAAHKDSHTPISLECWLNQPVITNLVKINNTNPNLLFSATISLEKKLLSLTTWPAAKDINAKYLNPKTLKRLFELNTSQWLLMSEDNNNDNSIHLSQLSTFLKFADFLDDTYWPKFVKILYNKYKGGHSIHWNEFLEECLTKYNESSNAKVFIGSIDQITGDSKNPSNNYKE